MKCMILTCSLKCIINNVKPPQNFEFPETKLPCSLFGLKSFHGFVSLAKLGDVTDSLSSVLFVLLFYLLWPVAVKTFKNINSNRNTQKELNNIT